MMQRGLLLSLVVVCVLLCGYIEAGNGNVIEARLHGASTVARDLAQTIHSILADDVRQRLLWTAVDTNDIALAKRLFAAGTSPNLSNTNGFTALHHAILRRYDQPCKRPAADAMLRYLIQECDVTACAKDGITPLHCATVAKRPDVARWLVEAGAPLNAQTTAGHTPLHYAAHHGVDNIAAALMCMGAQGAIRDEDGLEPWKCAGCAGSGWSVTLMRVLGMYTDQQVERQGLPLRAGVARLVAEGRTLAGMRLVDVERLLSNGVSEDDIEWFCTEQLAALPVEKADDTNNSMSRLPKSIVSVYQGVASRLMLGRATATQLPASAATVNGKHAQAASTSDDKSADGEEEWVDVVDPKMRVHSTGTVRRRWWWSRLSPRSGR